MTLETAAVGAALPGLLRHWFDEGYRRLAGWHRERVESGPKLPPEAIRRSIPCGPPGAAWAFVGVDRRTAAGRLKSSARVYRESTMRWFLDELADPPVTAQLGTAILDDRGYPDEHPIRFELYRTRVLYEMDWCRLTCTASARDLADLAVERAWLEFLRTAADMANPSFGH